MFELEHCMEHVYFELCQYVNSMSEENKKRFDIVRMHSYDVCQFGIFDHVATVPSMYYI